MSEVIPEKGVCRIVFESTDKDDDYCLDIDAESEIDQSEASSCEEDKVEIECRNSHAKYYWKEFNKRKHSLVKKIIENSSGSKFEDAKKQRKLSSFEQFDETEEGPPFQNVPDLSNMFQAELANLLENDNNTIIKSFSHKHKNDSFENFETNRVPKIQNNSIIDSRSFMEMTDAVRRLTEVLVLPINQNEVKEMHFAHQKEYDDLERENILKTVSITETSLIDNANSFINPCASSLLCLENTRPYPDQKKNHVTDIGDNFQQNATLQAYNWPLDECSEHVVPQKQENKEFEFDYGLDDVMDFNMAVEALNLLKNKGRIYSNSSNGYQQTSQTINAASFDVSDKDVAEKSSLTNLTIETPSIDENCSSTENKRYFLFDSTLEIRDCTTGALIPIESIYQNNNDFLTINENEFSTLNDSQNQIEIDSCIIPRTLTQLSDTVTCVKVPSRKSILSKSDQELEIRGDDYRYAAPDQDEEGQTNSTVLVDTSLKVSKRSPSFLCETKIRKKNRFKTTRSNQRWNQKSKCKADGEREIKQTNGDYSNSSVFSGKNIKGYKNHFKASPKVVTKKKSHDAIIKINKNNDHLEKKRRSSQTSDCSLEEQPLELSSSLVLENDSKPPKIYSKCTQKSRGLLQAFISTSSVLKSALHQPLENPAKQEEDTNNQNGYLEHFQNCFMPSKLQLDEEKQFDFKEQYNVDVEVKNPLSAFSLIINDNMIKRIVYYTNKKLLETAKNVKTAIYKKETNEIELRAFIGLLLISAALKQNSVKVSELWSECFGASIYRATLQEGRFQILLSKVSFGDATSTTVQSSKKNAFKIGDPWEEYLDNCKTHPIPKASVKVQKNSKDEDSRQYYTTVRKTINLSLSVLFSMLDSAVIRGLAVYQNENPQSEMGIRTFFKHIGMALVKPHLEKKLFRPTISNSMRELIECILSKKRITSKSVSIPGVDQTLKKQKRCQLCSWNKDRKTRHQCICCQRNMCKEHRAQLCIQCIDSI